VRLQHVNYGQRVSPWPCLPRSGFVQLGVVPDNCYAPQDEFDNVNPNKMYISMEKFLNTFAYIIRTALEYGIRNVPLKTSSDNFFKDYRHQKDFIKSCHRGYDKAQTAILAAVKEVHNDPTLDTEGKVYRELVYRRLLDAIAFTVLRTDSHVARRLELHDDPPKLNINVIEEAKKRADELNNESRFTFALLADLTTFIHVADILRIDFRAEHQPSISLIELKSGRVNEILTEKLKDYAPTPETLDKLRQDSTIETHHLPQAERIMRQRIRVEQIKGILRYDDGIDPKTNKPISLLNPTIVADSYGYVLNDCCKDAFSNAVSAATVQYCIHVGVGYSSSGATASRELAWKAALSAAFDSLEKAPKDLLKVRTDLKSDIDSQNLYAGFELLKANLHGMAAEPFPMWPIEREFLIDWISGKISIYLVFDLPAFIWLARQVGVQIQLASKKETGRAAASLGARQLLRWGDKALCIKTSHGPILMAGGMFRHFISSIKKPLPFIQSWT